MLYVTQLGAALFRRSNIFPVMKEKPPRGGGTGPTRTLLGAFITEPSPAFYALADPPYETKSNTN